jgi:hypothetical protein
MFLDANSTPAPTHALGAGTTAVTAHGGDDRAVPDSDDEGDSDDIVADHDAFSRVELSKTITSTILFDFTLGLWKLIGQLQDAMLIPPNLPVNPIS